MKMEMEFGVLGWICGDSSPAACRAQVLGGRLPLA
jgi:hypothetical protein